MLPVDVLVSEHQLILYTVSVLKKEQRKIVAAVKVDPDVIVAVVDFFRTYADRYHHGKEEGILFNALYKRKLSDVDGEMIRELILEHALARRTVTSLENLKTSYINGISESLNDIIDCFSTLIELYPEHIEKEDKHFFYPSMTYFTEKEQQEMLQKFLEFNENFTDNRYKQTMETIEQKG